MMAARHDYLCRRRHHVLEKLRLNRRWFRELSAYYRHLTIHEFWVRYTLVDLPTPMLEFARWRCRGFPNVETKEPGLGADLPLRRSYDVITCMDVLERVINPVEVVKHLAEHLKPGGTLHLNVIHAPGGENLVESAQQHAETIAYLNSALRGVVPLHVAAPNEVYARYVMA